MPRIYDCFTFYNELDLLEIRLNELDPIVDHFVLCEAPVTFKGKPKPLLFKENRERFERFLPKIAHIVVDDMPTGPDKKSVYWQRQTFQRNAIRRGLGDADADDFIILSDLDEIPRATAVESGSRVSSVKRTMSSPSALAGQKPMTPFADSQFSATILSSMAVASANKARAASPTFSSSRSSG